MTQFEKEAAGIYRIPNMHQILRVCHYFHSKCEKDRVQRDSIRRARPHVQHTGLRMQIHVYEAVTPSLYPQHWVLRGLPV